MPWSTKLSEPVKLADGRWLRTGRDAGEIILRLPEKSQKRECWTYTAELLLKAAEHGGNRADLQLYLTQSLKAEGMLPPREWLFRKRPR